MKYVALLRGINVGGKTKVDMKRLENTFESLRCEEVKTYINSGNVIFSDNRPADRLRIMIQKAIEQDFKLNVPVIIRDKDNIELLSHKIPSSWTNDKEQKTDVMFLWDGIDEKNILKSVMINPKIEQVIYLPGALVWNIGRENVVRGGAIKFIKTDIYKSMTIRNINTVRKLAELMQ